LRPLDMEIQKGNTTAIGAVKLPVDRAPKSARCVDDTTLPVLSSRRMEQYTFY
jgi:hypothetical protein